MWRRLKKSYLKFKQDSPGQRFKNLHGRWHEEGKGPAGTVLAVILATILIAGGFFLGFIPGVPGFVLGFVGLGILATQFRQVAKWCDGLEVAARKLVGKFRRREKHS
jgi:hypothetical protein